MTTYEETYTDELDFSPEGYANNRARLNHSEPASVRKAFEIVCENRHPEQVKRAKMVLAIWQERLARKAARLGLTEEAIAETLQDTERPEVTGVPKEAPKTYLWEGVEYETVAAIARETGYSRDSLSDWINAGHTSYEAAQAAIRARRDTYTWNGIEYPSCVAAARAHDYNQYTMREWFRKGYTCDEDVQDRRSQEVIWNGVAYPSIKAAAEAEGVSWGVMKRRVTNGWTGDSDVELKAS